MYNLLFYSLFILILSKKGRKKNPPINTNKNNNIINDKIIDNKTNVKNDIKNNSVFNLNNTDTDIKKNNINSKENKLNANNIVNKNNTNKNNSNINQILNNSNSRFNETKNNNNIYKNINKTKSNFTSKKNNTNYNKNKNTIYKNINNIYYNRNKNNTNNYKNKINNNIFRNKINNNIFSNKNNINKNKKSNKTNSKLTINLTELDMDKLLSCNAIVNLKIEKDKTIINSIIKKNKQHSKSQIQNKINADIFEICMNKITKSIAKEYFINLNLNSDIDYDSKDFDEFLHFDYSNYNENSIYNVTKAQEFLVYKLNFVKKIYEEKEKKKSERIHSVKIGKYDLTKIPFEIKMLFFFLIFGSLFMGVVLLLDKLRQKPLEYKKKNK